MKAKQVLLNGILQNPVFVLALGMCPTLGTSTTLESALFMGLSTLFVLICSNFIISLLRKIIPSSVRIPAYILIVATFVTVLEIIMARFLPEISMALGNYLALIVVNCIILGRAEAFASKNSVWLSMLDGISMGLGFVFSICLLGLTREALGANTLKLFNIDSVFGASYTPIAILVKPAGGFLVLGLYAATFNAIYEQINKKNEDKKFKQKIKEQSRKVDDKTILEGQNKTSQGIQAQPKEESL
ncbi:MAG: electron transport complex subunit E [Clostridia bacterium]|nr:electron transport complex subunit E [Clostridia bacterium]